jgi:hypothetical protein
MNKTFVEKKKNKKKTNVLLFFRLKTWLNPLSFFENICSTRVNSSQNFSVSFEFRKKYNTLNAVRKGQTFSQEKITLAPTKKQRKTQW